MLALCKAHWAAMNKIFIYARPCVNKMTWAFSVHCRSVIKELAHAFSCAYIELWMHLGSLESTQKARVALGCASSYSYAFFVLSKLPACIHNTHAKHEQILKFSLLESIGVVENDLRVIKNKRFEED